MTTDFYHSSVQYPLGSLSARTEKRRSRPLSELIVTSFLTLLNLGTDFIKERKQVKYIKISNFVAMTSFVASLTYMVLSIVWANPLWFMAVNSLCITSIVVLYLNKTGRVNISRIFYLVSVNSLLYLIALIVGPQTRAEDFLLIAVLIPFLMYDLDKVKRIIIGITIPVVFIISYQYLEPYFADYHLSLDHQNIMRTICVPMEAGLAIAAVFQFMYYSRVTELELEDTNLQLTLQTTELKRSNADLEQFAYVISHDLKTPVRNISCFMKLLSNKHSDALDAEAKEFIDFAINGSKRMERLIDDVLAYSRIGRNLTVPTPVNLNDVVNTIKYEIEGRTEMENVTININKELPIIESAHSSLMYHIFQNMIRNGIKFNKNAHPVIDISWSDSADYYVFKVSDNGIGIEKQYTAQVFQMFKRLHNENEYDGTGIGLAICKKIVENYNGEIWFEKNEAGEGTTFYFTIRKY